MFIMRRNSRERIHFNLQDIPQVGPAIARILIEHNINSPSQLANLSSDHILFHDISSFELIREYARAIVNNNIIVKEGIQIEFEKIIDQNIYFFDVEYNSAGTKNGSFGIFLLGWMNREGKVKQLFLDNPDNELKILMEFNEWLEQEDPLLIAYSSKSADEPQLYNSFNKYNLPTTILKERFFDIYRDVINTQKLSKQKVYLPTKPFTQLNVSDFLGYQSRKKRISDGLDALLKYQSYLETNSKFWKNIIKRQLLKYNRDDLNRLKFIFEKLQDLLL